MAAVACLVGAAALGPAWGVAAALGPVTAIGYFRLLSAQTRRVLAAGRVPAPGLLAVAIAGRQAFCVAVPAACWHLLGEPWLACVATLVVARHWIVVTARPSAQPTTA
ncbi:MAG: hypothetical protein VKS61_17755 [Candidatus Sericytochromatia bacterium]|nr:hypothetical protein [Candidatus Sericytochromatia bacterium]